MIREDSISHGSDVEVRKILLTSSDCCATNGVHDLTSIHLEGKKKAGRRYTSRGIKREGRGPVKSGKSVKQREAQG